MRSWMGSEEKGELKVSAQANLVGDDLAVILWGGSRPHIGAVGIAEPRPSLKDPRITSATGSVFTFLGHKEDVVAKEMSEYLAGQLDRKVVVLAGMHWEELDREGIEEVITMCQRLKERILEWMREG